MKKLFKLSLVAFLIAVLSFGCDKLSEPDKATGRDVHLGELAVSDVFTFTDSETDGGKKYAKYDTTCFDVDVIQNEDSSFTTTITFVDSCDIGDGVMRSGQIIITWQAGWRLDTSKQVTVTFNDFSRDGNTISGNLVITRTDDAINSYQVTENNMKILLSSSEEVTWSGVRNVEWKKGFLTVLDRTDNVKMINFEREGVNRNGEEFTAEGIDLKLSNECDDHKPRIVDGVIEINNLTLDQETTVEFNGCSDTFIINGVEVNP